MLRSLLLSFFIAASVIGLGSPAIAQAEERTVTLHVENMTCSMCPYTVKKALKKVDGVKAVEAKYEGKGVGWAKVAFDTGVTSVDSLIDATTQAGYPSKL